MEAVFSLILVFLCVFSTSRADQASVNERRVWCLKDTRQVNLACQADQMMVIMKAAYFQSRASGCWPDHDSRCKISDVSRQLLGHCYKRRSCDINVSDFFDAGGSCAGYSGSVYLEVDFNCQPWFRNTFAQSVRNMCDMPEPWTGSYLYIWNSNFPSFTNDDDCGCDITVHQDAEVAVYVPLFIGRNVANQRCDPLITMGNSSYRKQICHGADDVFRELGLSVKSGWYIHMENLRKADVLFFMFFQVHHLHNITFSCRRNFTPPALQASIPPPTTGTAVQRTTSQYANQEPVVMSKTGHGHWPMTTGVVAGVAVVLLIGTAVLIFLRKKQRLHLAKVFSARATRRNVFENTTYVSHEDVLQNSRNHAGGASAGLPPDPPPYRPTEEETKVNLFPMAPAQVNSPEIEGQGHGEEANNGITYSVPEKNSVVLGPEASSAQAPNNNEKLDAEASNV